MIGDKDSLAAVDHTLASRGKTTSAPPLQSKSESVQAVLEVCAVTCPRHGAFIFHRGMLLPSEYNVGAHTDRRCSH